MQRLLEAALLAALLTAAAQHDNAPRDLTRPSRLSPPLLIHVTSTSISVRWVQPEEDGGTPVLGYALYGGAEGTKEGRPCGRCGGCS